MVVMVVFVLVGKVGSRVMWVVRVGLWVIGWVVGLEYMGLRMKRMRVGGMGMGMGWVVEDGIVDVEKV